jgi:hypothetical protein
MKKVDSNRIKFYEFLNGNISTESFESWVHENEELKDLFPAGHYTDLISFNYKSRELKPYIKSLVKKFLDWGEFEKWRTIELLKKIKSNKIELVLASHKLFDLYFDQVKEIKQPLISKTLALGYYSELDGFPIESQYHLWNPVSLKKKLEQLESYRKRILEEVDNELNNLLKSK